MKNKILTILFIIISVSLSAQFKEDTIYSIDSVWHNDTLYITKTKHIIVKVLHESKIKKISNFNIEKSLEKEEINATIIKKTEHKNINISENRIRKNYVINNKISPFAEIGILKAINSFNNNILNNSHELLLSSIGLDYKLERNNFIFSSGIRQTTILEKYNYTDQWVTIDSSIITKILTTQIKQIDTIWYLNADSLMVGDSVWEYFCNTTLKKVTDTLNITEYDSLQNSRQYKRLQHLNFIEIPVIFGYNFNFNKINISLMGGIIFGFPLWASYRINRPQNKGEFTTIFSSINYYTYIRLLLEYNLTKKTTISAGFYFRSPLKHQLLVFNNKRKYYSYGLSLNFSITL